jgi:predicted nucleic-acid-binding protein
VIGLDTNVLVRFFQQDDPAQSARAGALLASLTPANPGYISLVVLIELVWVLTGSYELRRSGTASILSTLLVSRDLVIEHAPIVSDALRLYQLSKADFSDCLIQCEGRAAGCDYTVTFDKAAARTAGMRLLK